MNLFNRYFKGFHEAGGFKELLMLALPMVISTACDGVMTFTDRLFLSRIAPEQMNAALGGGITFQMLTFFFTGLTGYSTALVAQYFGAGERSSASKTLFQAILITILAWPVILLLKPLANNYFSIMNLPESQLGFQIKYLNILIWGGLFTLMRFTLGCFFTGIGKTRVVMVATIAAMIVNVGLDYVLIFGKFGMPAMGIQGAALATISGAFVAVIILLISYFESLNRIRYAVMQSFRFDWGIMKKLLYFGSPAGLEMFLNFLAFSIMVSLFQARGPEAATAATIMFNWDLVSFIPLLGIEVAVTSLVGRYMGAQQPGVAQHAAISGMKTGIFYSVIILFLFVCIPETLVRVFHPQTYSAVFEQAVPMAVSMIKIAALYVMAEAIMVATVGALRGAGDTYFTMVTSVSAHWLFIPILYLALNVFKLSVPVGWLFLVVFFLIFCLILIVRFFKGKWKTIKVIQS